MVKRVSLIFSLLVTLLISVPSLSVSAAPLEPFDTLHIPIYGIYRVVTYESFDTVEASFTLKGLDGAPMPNGSTGNTKTIKTTSNKAFNFGTITFDEMGTYEYLVYRNPSDNDRLVQDTSVYRVRIGCYEIKDYYDVIIQLEGQEEKCEQMLYTDQYQYCVSFDPAGGNWDGDTSVVSKYYTLGTEINMPEAPQREGYTFCYWSGCRYDAGERYRVCEDHTFTAVWEKAEPSPGPDPVPETESFKTVDEALKNGAGDDLEGCFFSPLRLRSLTQGKNWVGLKWTNITGAKKYILYGTLCGTSGYVRLGDSAVSGLKVRGIGGMSLKKGTFYKFRVVALDSDGEVIAISKTCHVVTKGSKWKNATGVKILNAKKAKKLKVGKSLKIKAKIKGKNVRQHLKKAKGLRFESSDTSVAKVTKKGKIKAKGTGTCYVTVYAQNGRYKQMKVVVK